MRKHYKRTIAIDFDGVIHIYTQRWLAPEVISDGPTPGALEAVKAYLEHGFDVVIFSSRAKSEEGKKAIYDWLREHGFPSLLVTAEKPQAIVYMDDRGLRFEGEFPSAEALQGMKPWNKP